MAVPFDRGAQNECQAVGSDGSSRIAVERSLQHLILFEFRLMF